MFYRNYKVSTRGLLSLAVALAFFVTGMENASAATNSGPAPVLVPYTINAIAGFPLILAPASTVAGGYAGEGTLATPTIDHPLPVTKLNAPYSMAVDSVGNVYITDTGNDIIREVNAQTGLITTIAGVAPKGCSGGLCSIRTTGCADGVLAAGNPIGNKVEGIAVDGYGNIYFDDLTTGTVSVIYRGGTQVANFIAFEDPGGVKKSNGAPQVGYVYHVAGTINLNTCSATTGNADNLPAFEDSSTAGTDSSGNVLVTGGQLKNPTILSLDSAGNIYITDTGNLTTRVVNTQATAQTFFQYTVQPGYIRSITNCNSVLTAACPTATTTSSANTGINGPVNGLVFNSQFKYATVDAYGNVYQGNGTGGGTGAPGIYSNVAYAGGSPITNLLTAEAPSLDKFYGPNGPNGGNAPSELPLTYGRAYITQGNPQINSGSLIANFPDVYPTQNQNYDIRPASFRADPMGNFWYLDTHYPELSRVDQYTSLATMIMWWKGRALGTIGQINTSQPSFSNPYYCVYGNTNNAATAWTQGPQTYDPEGDGCPAAVAFMGGSTSSGPDTVSDGLGDIYYPDDNNQIMRELPVGTSFPSTTVGSSVTQAIQVHFNSANPPVITGISVPDAGDTDNSTTTSFAVTPGSTDFSIDTTTPEFPFGSLLGGGGAGNNTQTANFAMWAGLPTCTQLGVYPTPVSNPVDNDWDCLVYVKFNPSAPGRRQGQLLVTTAPSSTNPNGAVYTFGLSGVATGGQLAIDGGNATKLSTAGLGTASAVAVNSAGTVYIADSDNNRILVEPSGAGTQTTIGPSLNGLTPDLKNPQGVAVDAAGNVYISDTGNNRVLKITPDGSASLLGQINWLSCPVASAPNASNGETACKAAPSVNVPQYQFNAPQGLAVDQWNNVYVADTGNSAVVEIPSNIQLGGAIPLLNYPGAPKFVKPVAVAVDAKGNIYVADNGSQTGQIVVLPPGGGDMVTLPTSVFTNLKGSFQSPNGVAVDAAGDLFVSDNSTNQVVEVPSATGGPGTAQFALNLPNLNGPAGLALDANGNLYIADSGNKQILFQNRQNPVLDFGTVPQALTNAPTATLTVINTGTQAVPLVSPFTTVTSITPAGNTAFNVTNNSCSGTSLAAGTACTISVSFNPTSDGPQGENLTINGGSQTVQITANGEQPLASIVLSASYTGGSSSTSPTANATATITATVTQPHISGQTPTGTVTFNWAIDANAANAPAKYACGSNGTPGGGATSGSTTVALTNGVASFNLPTLAQGLNYTINATYTPDAADTLDTGTSATPLVLQVPGIQETATAASVSFTYGQKVPTITGSVSPALPSGITAQFTTSASPTTAVGTYPIQVYFTSTTGNYCAYGFPTVLTSGGQPAVVTENQAPLTYTLPNESTVYGALPLNYGAGIQPTGIVNGDKFSATFTPANSQVLNVGTYTLTPTVTGPNVGNYKVTAKPSTLTVTAAPSGISVGAAQTAVLNTTAGVSTATFTINVGTLVSQGIGIPTGTVTVTDTFTPMLLTAPGPGTPAAPTTTVLTLDATGTAIYTPTSTTPGTHSYAFAYSGDSNFQCSVSGQAATSKCPTTGTTPITLLVDYPDYTLASSTGVVNIIPGVTPSGNGLPTAPNQSTTAPETAIINISGVLGFAGQINLTCSTQNAYVSCSMTPPNVTLTASGTGASTASILSVWTPATLPLGYFNKSEVRTSASKTVLAFLPLGVLAFCVRRRRRLSKLLWMLIAIAAVGAGMQGCGGNQVSFYTPVPTGPQTVTVHAEFTGNSSAGVPDEQRSLDVPINID